MRKQLTDGDDSRLLGLGDSFASHDRRVKATFFEKKAAATDRVDKRIVAEANGDRKRKIPVGNFDNYDFDKEGFLEEIGRVAASTYVNWSVERMVKYPKTVARF